MPPAPPRLAISGICKRFPGVVANDDVSLAIGPGERHGLVGENGAGKSTLVKIACGLIQPDAGAIAVDGRTVALTSPRAARRLGVGVVFQHFALFDALTVAENIALGLDEAVPRRELRDRVAAVLAAYRMPLDLDREAGRLSVGERQRIEIVRCLLARPRILLMDEPTSVLTPQEAERLLDTLRQLSQEGCAILYVSHKLAEVEALCGRATILRGGRVVATCDPREAGAARMAEHMIGAAPTRTRRAAAGSARAAFGPPRLQVEGLTVEGLTVAGRSGEKPALSDVAFEVRGGEILGVAGVAGNGQSALVEALSGERPAARDEAIRLDGRPIGRLGPTGRRRLGLCCLPEERNGHAAIPALTLDENAVLTARTRRRLAGAGLVRWPAARRYAGEVIARFGVKAGGPGALASSLSGGNLQKYCVGREIGQDPGVLVVAQPTWGVDAGAAAAIHAELRALAAGGAALVLVSQDLDELFALADTIRVLDAGRLSRPLDPARTTAAELGLMMGGVPGPAPGLHAA